LHQVYGHEPRIKSRSLLSDTSSEFSKEQNGDDFGLAPQTGSCG
jgi:hypothetical protein